MTDEATEHESNAEAAGQNQRLVMPDSCSSLSCVPPHNHCIKCSHALWFGEIVVSGRRWNFEFSPVFGPTFITLSGNPKQVQPGEKSPVWDIWQKWYDAKFKA